MTVPSPGTFLVFVAAALPWIGYFYEPNATAAVLLTPSLVFYSMGLVGLSLWLAERDPWMGLFALWATAQFIYRPGLQAAETVMFLVVGCATIQWVATVPSNIKQYARTALWAFGLLQVVVVACQRFWYDPLWPHSIDVTGSIGNPGYVGMYLALLCTVAPLPALAVLIAGIFMTKSTAALLAVGVALVSRKRAEWRTGLFATFAIAGLWFVVTHPTLSSFQSRLDVWQLALSSSTWQQWIVGHGVGTWIQAVPLLQLQKLVWHEHVFIWAHSDVVQALYEFGAVGFVCFGGWLWAHRAWMFGDGAPLAVTILVLALCWFPFHLAAVGVTACVLLGLSLDKLDDGRYNSAK